MPAKILADNALSDAVGIEKVWKANPEIKLGKGGDTIALADYQASIKALNDLNGQIGELRHQLDGLLDQRDDAALKLNGYNTRTLSAIRGIFGPDSAEYDQAGGTRASERKVPARKAQAAVAQKT
jgi:hypothetical protein